MKINAVETVLGQRCTPVEDLAGRFDMAPGFLANKIGVKYIRKLAEDEDSSDLAVNAADSLLARLGMAHAEVEGLVLCTQNGDREGLPHTSAIVHHKLALDRHSPCFDVSLGCSGFVYSLQAADAFAESLGLSNVIIITVDPYSKIIDSDDRDTALLFSDAASATLLSYGEGFGLGSAVFSTLGERSECLVRRNGKLKMNGREVFNSVLDTAPADIDEILGREGVARQDIDAFLFHQGSKFIVDSLRKRMGLREDQVPLDIENGNTVSSTIPSMLGRVLDDPGINRVVLSGFGVGFSSASMFVSR